MIELENKIADWKNLKILTQKISKATHSTIRKQYTQDLYNGVKAYWEKYHCKFDFSKQPSE